MDPTSAHWHDMHFDYLDEMHKLGKDRLVVSAVIVAKGKVLLLRRSPDDSYPGTWEFPGGGVEHFEDENLVEALRREVLEETGIGLPEFPVGEILTHPTRTALRIVLRFNIDNEVEVRLSHEHDSWLYVDVHGAREAYVDGINVFEAMRDESRDILEMISDKSMGQNP